MTKQSTEKTAVTTQPKTDVVQAVPMGSLQLIKASLTKNWKGVPEETKATFIAHLCHHLNISPPLNPFRFIEMKGIEVLYADKRAAAVIANANHVSTEIVKELYDKEKQILKIYVRAHKGAVYSDEFAALHLGSNAGEARANLEMKCLTKAKRRAILALVDLAIPDEDELQYLQSLGSQAVARQKDLAENPVTSLPPTPENESIDINDVMMARTELMDHITQGDSKMMNTLKKFIASNTEGKELKDLDYDECAKLTTIWDEALEDVKKVELVKKEEIKTAPLPTRPVPPTPSEDNDIPEIQEEMFSKEDIEKGPFA